MLTNCQPSATAEVTSLSEWTVRNSQCAGTASAGTWRSVFGGVSTTSTVLWPVWATRLAAISSNDAMILIVMPDCTRKSIYDWQIAAVFADTPGTFVYTTLV